MTKRTAVQAAQDAMAQTRYPGQTVLQHMESAARHALAEDADADAQRVASAIVRSIGSATDLKRAVVESLVDFIEGRRRETVRDIEHQATLQRQYEEAERERESPEARERRRIEWEAEWAQVQAQEAARQEVVRKRLEQAAEEYAAQVRLELMEEFLAAPFVLPDGRRVTWGDATAADHEDRAGALLAMAKGTTITAARHMAAVALLHSHGVTRLRDVQRPPLAVAAGGKA